MRLIEVRLSAELQHRIGFVTGIDLACRLMAFQTKSLFYTTAQFLLAAGLVLSVRLSEISWISLVTLALGILIEGWSLVSLGRKRLSVFVESKADSTLETTGPYRFVRHPMYSGLLLLTLGCAACGFNARKLATWAMLAIVLHQKSRFEETLLSRQFSDYERYKSRTKRFIPYVY